MADLAIFSFHEKQVRTVLIDNVPYFVGNDVATLLGYKVPNNAITKHCKGATLFRGVIDSMGRPQDSLVIPERDVYRLIMKSKLPEAEKFEEWVVSEVIPSIRKDGEYKIKPLSQIEIIAQSAQILLEQDRKIQEHDQRILQLEAKAMTSNVEFFAVSGYAHNLGKKITWLEAQAFWKKAMALSKELGYKTGRVPDAKWGHVWTYHTDILSQIII